MKPRACDVAGCVADAMVWRGPGWEPWPPGHFCLEHSWDPCLLIEALRRELADQGFSL